MVFLKGFVLATAVALCAAAVPFASAPAWADGGGAGIQFQIQYDENAGDDEDDEEPEGITFRPVGFSSGLTLKYDVSRGLNTDVTYAPEPAEQKTWDGVTLGGPSFSEDKITYFTPRFNAHFPGISYTPAAPGTAVDVGEPVKASATFEIKPRFERWTWLWAGETAVEEAAKDPSPRVGYSLSADPSNDLRLSASYTMWKDDAEKAQPQAGAQQTGTQQASAGSASLAESFKTMSHVQVMQEIFGLSKEKAEEAVDGMSRFIQNERARNYLGNDTYRKLQEQFGSAPANAGSGLQSYTLDSAADHSGWSGAYLYCGGACVYGF
jgi:hypothetical protein